MSDQSDLERTEPATPRRLEKAREDGQVARSRELSTFMLLAAGVALLWISGGRLYHGLAGRVRAGLWFDPAVAHDTGHMLIAASRAAVNVFWLVLPVFGGLVLVALTAPLVLGGLVLSGKALAFKAERLSPLKGFKRMVSANTAIELGKTLAKAAIVALVACVAIMHHSEPMIALMFADPAHAIAAGVRLVALCCALIVAALLLIVLIDAPWQIYSHHRKLRMSRQDVKQEHKESEGDPQLKAHIRQQQRARARQRMVAGLARADVVVTNPRHFAVALAYDDARNRAPVVVAKGVGLLAVRIRSLAGEREVPVLESSPLARALYWHAELDQEIPADLYAAVAEVLAWVYRLRAWHQGYGPQPERPAGLPVPPEMTHGPR